MKKIIKINLKSKKYEIVIENNAILKNINSEKKLCEKIFIVIDTKVLYLIKDLKIDKNLHIIKIKGGEKIKSVEYFNNLSIKLLRLNINRNSTIFTIGGGTIGDLSGFVASTILRGVKHILIPTTLLSQVDSSIGGKTGINTVYGKNLIGTFYQPDKVIIDTSLLKSLPKKEIRSGYAEILKHAVIKDKNFYQWLKINYKNIINLKSEFISKAIIESIKIKTYFVKKDENEKLLNKSSRAMLNFGHTFGHALETMNKYNNKLTHGEAIAIGMSVAFKISNRLKYINDYDCEDFIGHLKKIKLPFYDHRIKSNKIYRLINQDKKNLNNQINLILLKDIGNAFFMRGLEIKEIRKLLK